MEDTQRFGGTCRLYLQLNLPPVSAAVSFLDFLINSEGGGDIFLRNVRTHLNNTVYRTSYSHWRVNFKSNVIYLVHPQM
jgi:hypothetical protein